MDSSVKLFVILFSSICGLAYFTYGRKQRKLVPTLAGLGLMVYPYLVSHLVWLIGLGLVGLVLPWVLHE